MTKVDKYLNKYLEGSITESEMQEFRDLLESEPHLQTEMRQILDLRSLVHDDFLELNPPQFLSDSVREMVGERFAALTEEEEEEKRRPLFFTERIAGSLVTAMVALVLVALAPTLIAPSGNNNRRSDADLAALERFVPNVAGNSGEEARAQAAQNGAQKSVRENTDRRSIPGNQVHSALRGVTEEATTQTDASTLADISAAPENSAVVESGIATATTSTSQSTEPEGTEVAVNQSSDNGGNGHTLNLPQRADILFAASGNEALNLERGRPISPSFNRTADMIESELLGTHEEIDYIASALPSISREAESDNSSKPRIAFGFTVGAGSLTNSPASVALTGGAGYAALSLSESNRIGIEAGGSKFRYVHTTYTQEILPPLGKSSASAGEVWETGTNGGMVAGVYQVYGNGNSEQSNGTIVPQSRPRTTDPTQIGDTKGRGAEFFGDRASPVLPPPSSGTGIIQSHTYESDTSMGYGMLFYDRRVIALNDELNIRSRVGLGGTNGGLILDLRAYAAFATSRNVAITLGVGGSALRELSQEGKLNANYGLQVGAEVGF